MKDITDRASDREELLARCRRERDELARLTTSTVTRWHARDLVRALRLLRRVMRAFDPDLPRA
jgi:hypothetical protein